MGFDDERARFLVEILAVRRFAARSNTHAQHHAHAAGTALIGNSALLVLRRLHQYGHTETVVCRGACRNGTNGLILNPISTLIFG